MTKHRKSIRSMIKSHNTNINEKSRLLVQCILNKDPLSANNIFPDLVKESEDLRELEVKQLLLEDDEDDWGDDQEDTGDQEEDTGDEDGEDTTDGEAQQDEDQADTDANTVIDDATEIKCQINAKVIENLFDVISDLKNTLNSKELDETSKEFIVLDTTISYYSDKLQELQAQTNPGTDQTKLEEKLDTISKALDELKEKAGESDGSSDDDVESPQDVEDSEEETDTEQEDEETDTDQEDEEDVDQDAEDETEQSDNEEEQESDEDF